MGGRKTSAKKKLGDGGKVNSPEQGKSGGVQKEIPNR